MFRIILSAVLALVSLPAFASGTDYTESGNAQGICDPAMAVYDAKIRQRPLGAFNEGTGAGFLNCNLRYQSNGYGWIAFSFKVKNLNTGSRTVTCTGIAGVEDSAIYRVKTVTVAANSSTAVTFSANEFTNGQQSRLLTNASWQCNLMPLTGVTETAIGFKHAH